MEHEPIRFESNETEDGEISDSDDGYNPLQRPELTQMKPALIAATTSKIDDHSDQEDITFENSSDSNDSDGGFKIKKTNTLLLPSKRINPVENLQPDSKRKFDKYNIWSASLQEETLLQNMQVCDVTKNEMRSRNVEAYDFALKYRLNGEMTHNKLKRKQSHSDDSESGQCFAKKRFRSSNNRHFSGKKSIKDRLGRRSSDSSNSNSNDSIKNNPRYILDLIITESSSNDEVAKDIADKLYEEKDDLLLRAINILGRQLPIQLFKETQKIESEGGMLIMNGKRRRTPGGVFLFLLKHNDDISSENRKLIFLDEKKSFQKEQKKLQAMNRDKKVEELKKSLNLKDKELPVLNTRTELLMSHLKPETHNTLSNPPPSPVTDCNRENSSDFDTHAIQHVNITSPEKTTQRAQDFNSYEEDFLDMNCDDMDLI